MAFDLKKLLQDATNGLAETAGLRQRVSTPQPASTSQPKVKQKTQSNFFIDAANNIGQGAQNVNNLSKTLLSGIQQGAGVVGDVGIQAGSVIANPLVKAFNPDVAQYVDQATVDYTTPLRTNLQKLKDAEGKNIVGTSNVDANATKIATGQGNIQDYAAVLGKGLEAANAATMFASPIAIARGMPLKQAVALGAKDAALFGTTGGTQAGLQTYGATGDLGQAAKSAVTTGLISGATQGVLDIGAPIAGAIARRGVQATGDAVKPAVQATTKLVRENTPTSVAQRTVSQDPRVLGFDDQYATLAQQFDRLDPSSPQRAQVNQLMADNRAQRQATANGLQRDILQGGYARVPGNGSELPIVGQNLNQAPDTIRLISGDGSQATARVQKEQYADLVSKGYVQDGMNMVLKPKALETPTLQTNKAADLPEPKRTSDVSFVDTVKTAPQTSDELASRLTSRKGDVITNEESLGKAAERINKRGLEQSIERAKTEVDGTTDIQAESLQLISELQKQGRHGDALDIVEATADRARKNGQATQILAAYNRLTPEGVVLSAQRAIKKAIKENPTKNGNLKLTEQQAQKLYQTAKDAQAAAPDPKLSQAVIDTKKAIEGKTGAAKREATRQYEIAQDAFDVAEDAQIMAQKKVQDELLRVIPSSNAKKAILIWKAGLLTGIKGAFGGAAIGNATNVLLRSLRDVPATAIDTAIAKFTGNRTKAFTLKGIASGFIDGAESAVREFKNGGVAADLATKFDYEKTLFSEKPLGKIAQKYTDTVFGIYGAVDKPFKELTVKRSLYEQAKVASINEKVPSIQRTKFISDFVENPPVEALENATNEALEATFQQKTGLGSALSGFKQNAWRQSEAVGATAEVLAPFTGIPSAVTSAIAKYNPAGAPITIYKAIKKSSNGEFTPQAQKELVTALGNQITGLGILWLGANLAKDNLMTLGYPSDPKERKLWEAEGKTPYSIKVGDSWRSLNYTGPLMVMLAAGGKFNQEKDKGNDIIGSATAAALGVPKTVLESSPLSGIDKFLDAINTLETSEGDVSKAAERYIGNTISSAIPTLVSDISKASDDKIRETNNIIQQIQTKIPGLRNQLQPAHDAFGNELKRRNSAAGTLLDPFKSSKETKLEGAESEARRLQDAGMGILPTEAKDAEGSFKGQSREELNNINKRIGSTVIDEWDKVITDPRYASLSDEDKKKVLDRANDTAYGVIKSEYTDVNLNTRQKAYVAGQPVDYFDGIIPETAEEIKAKEDKKIAKKTTKTKKASTKKKSTAKKGKYDYAKLLETTTATAKSNSDALRKLVNGSKITRKKI